MGQTSDFECLCMSFFYASLTLDSKHVNAHNMLILSIMVETTLLCHFLFKMQCKWHQHQY